LDVGAIPNFFAVAQRGIEDTALSVLADPGDGEGGVSLRGLFPHVGFIVTNLETDRGKAEQWIKEGKQAVKMTRLSCH